jgi:hypothetical protein
MATERRRQIERFVLTSPALRPLLLRRDLAPPLREPYPQARQIAKELLKESEFEALGLASWLRSPDGRLIAQGVALAIDPAYRPEYDLAVEALRAAAKLQYERGADKRAAGVIALIGTAVLVGMAFAPSPASATTA